MTITIKPEKLCILRLDIWGTVSVFIVDLNADIREVLQISQQIIKNYCWIRCRNIRTMQNVTNRNLIDPNKSGT